MLSLDYILKNTLWVTRYHKARVVDTYDKISVLTQDKDCENYKLVRAKDQPKDLRKFYEAFEAYIGKDKDRFITVQGFYNNIWAKREEEMHQLIAIISTAEDLAVTQRKSSQKVDYAAAAILRNGYINMHSFIKDLINATEGNTADAYVIPAERFEELIKQYKEIEKSL